MPEKCYGTAGLRTSAAVHLLGLIEEVWWVSGMSAASPPTGVRAIVWLASRRLPLPSVSAVELSQFLRCETSSPAGA